jgi:GntR family transcriptional regulator / MocR family aminotransferase
MASETEPVGPELLLALEPSAGPLHQQLEHRLRAQIRAGQLAPGTRLPSSRSLAQALKVSRGVVLEAYGQLTAEGYLTASQGAPTRVAAAPSAERPPLPASTLDPGVTYDLRPEIPDLTAFPAAAWARSVRAAVSTAPHSALGPGDPRGTAELRNELLRYLGRARGAAPEPEHTLITGGFAQGYALLCRTLADRGVERIAVEDPGRPIHRLIAERAGLVPAPIPVDADGIDVTALGRSGCDAVVVTPAHQFPAGVVLGAERRAALLAWAEDVDALIVEDDYDSELRYDRTAPGALQGLAPERVAFIGSTRTRLAPAIRIGWVLSPSWLTGPLTFEQALTGSGAPALDQLAFSNLLARGEFDRHLRRMRLRYGRRRANLAASLARAVPAATLHGIAAGLHLLVRLPPRADEAATLSAAAVRGIGVDGLADHATRPQPPGLVLGYGNIPDAAIARAVHLLAEAVSTATASV